MPTWSCDQKGKDAPKTPKPAAAVGPGALLTGVAATAAGGSVPAVATAGATAGCTAAGGGTRSAPPGMPACSMHPVPAEASGAQAMWTEDTMWRCGRHGCATTDPFHDFTPCIPIGVPVVPTAVLLPAIDQSPSC